MPKLDAIFLLATTFPLPTVSQGKEVKKKVYTCKFFYEDQLRFSFIEAKQYSVTPWKNYILLLKKKKKPLDDNIVYSS